MRPSTSPSTASASPSPISIHITSPHHLPPSPHHYPFHPKTNIPSHRTARNSLPLEVLGTYDPIPRVPIGGEGRKYKDLRLDTSRAKYWLGVGAQPSDPAWRLLSMVGLLEPRFGVEGKIARRAREEGMVGNASGGSEEMVGVQGEEVGEVRVKEVQGAGATENAAI